MRFSLILLTAGMILKEQWRSGSTTSKAAALSKLLLRDESDIQYLEKQEKSKMN
jgi:hypothetical protein